MLLEMSLVAAGAALVSLLLILMFLLVVYFKGGKEDMKVAAVALHKVRDVGVGPSIRHAIEAWKSKDKSP